jgi:hypothetical protein
MTGCDNGHFHLSNDPNHDDVGVSTVLLYYYPLSVVSPIDFGSILDCLGVSNSRHWFSTRRNSTVLAIVGTGIVMGHRLWNLHRATTSNNINSKSNKIGRLEDKKEGVVVTVFRNEDNTTLVS